MARMIATLHDMSHVYSFMTRVGFSEDSILMDYNVYPDTHVSNVKEYVFNAIKARWNDGIHDLKGLGFTDKERQSFYDRVQKQHGLGASEDDLLYEIERLIYTMPVYCVQFNNM